MPAYDFRCACGRSHEITLSIHDDCPPSRECQSCGGQAARVFGVPNFTYDGGRQRFHDTTLAAERRKADDGLDKFLAHPGNKWDREQFSYGNHRAELV